MIEAARRVAFDRQSGRFNRLCNRFGAFAAAGRRVTQGVKFLGEAPKIVDRFRTIGKADRRHCRIPMRADNDDRSRLRKRIGRCSQRRTGGSGSEGKSRRAVRDKKGMDGHGLARGDCL